MPRTPVLTRAWMVCLSAARRMIRGMSTGMLGQQELMTPPQRRKLAVVAGHEAWWGIDPSTQRIALAGCGRGRGVWSRELPFAPLRDGVERLNAIYEATRKMIVGVATCVPWPGVVWVEQASGSSRNLPLEYAVGVIQAAVFAGLLDVCGRAVRVESGRLCVVEEDRVRPRGHLQAEAWGRPRVRGAVLGAR
jgi:hypothetical protein